MTKLIAVAVLSLVVFPALADIKPCEELKSEIAAKLDAKGVKNYRLEVVPAEQVKDQTVVGSCEGGRKKITCQKDPVPGKS